MSFILVTLNKEPGALPIRDALRIYNPPAAEMMRQWVIEEGDDKVEITMAESDFRKLEWDKPLSQRRTSANTPQ